MSVRRVLPPEAGMLMRASATGAPLTVDECMVQVDPERGILPETRCACCALESLWRLHDADGTVDEHVAAFRGPLPHAKFSKSYDQT